MLIKYVTGDIFASGAECLINTVNCDGYMGKGIAYQFKMKFPENNKSYVKACKNGSLHPGTLHVFVEDGITIINFPTKDRWRENSKLSYIETGLDELLKVLPELQVTSIAIPPLGCGNGGLQWPVVKHLIEEKLKKVEDEYTFLIYEPGGNYVQKPKTAPKLSASSLIIMKLKMGLKKHTKLRLQKAAYFMDIFAGESYFSFQKHKYGPYAYAIDIVGRDIGAYQEFYQIKDTETTYQMAYKTICSEKTDKTLERLLPAVAEAVQYVNQIESDHNLEGISTVLFLVQSESEQAESQIIQKFKTWSEDKALRFSEDEIKKYIRYLETTGLIQKNAGGNFECASFRHTEKLYNI